jgi:hypothetical protein
LKNENYELCFLVGSFVDQITAGKKGAVVWLSVGMFGGSMSSDCFGGFLDQFTAGKKGTVVWPLVAMSDCFGGFVAMFFWRVPQSNYKLRPEKKGTVVWPLVGMSTTYF